MRSRLTVILNGSAGSGGSAELCELIARWLADYKVQVLLAPNGAAVAAMARDAVAQSDAIVAGGGDGTVNAVASAVIGSGVTLGILPLGTFNHFARDLQIPTSLEQACRTIAGGYVERVDVGKVNGHIFLNNSSIGIYPRLICEREHERELGFGKHIAFLLAAVSVLRRYPRLTVRILADDEILVRFTPFVFVGNNIYESGGLEVGRRSALNHGELCVYVPRHGSRRDLLKLGMRALLHRLKEADDLDMLSARQITIETYRRQVRVATDGEVQLMNLPLHYRSLPGALRVIVPATEAQQAA
jgi:diacylglycerol kinase family enzyme